MFKWQTSVGIAITISLFHCLADKWNPTPRPMPTQSQSIWQHDARERENERDKQRWWVSESKSPSSAEWKPKRLSSCLTYTTCRNYSGIFGSWPLELLGIDCQWCAAPIPFFFTQPMSCHKSMRAKFLAKALKALQKAQFFLVLPAMLSCLCHVEQKQLPALPALPVASFACGYGSSVRVAYTPRGTHAKDIVGKWMNGKLKAIFCLSRDGSMYVCALSSCSNSGCCCCCCACVDFACSHCLKLAPGIWLFSPYNACRIQRNQANISPLPAHLYATSQRPHWT